MPQVLANVCTDILSGIRCIHTPMKRIAMNQWHLPLHITVAVEKKVFKSVVRPNESVEVGRGRSRKVHDKVGKSRW